MFVLFFYRSFVDSVYSLFCCTCLLLYYEVLSFSLLYFIYSFLLLLHFCLLIYRWVRCWPIQEFSRLFFIYWLFPRGRLLKIRENRSCLTEPDQHSKQHWQTHDPRMFHNVTITEVTRKKWHFGNHQLRKTTHAFPVYSCQRARHQVTHGNVITRASSSHFSYWIRFHYCLRLSDTWEFRGLN